MAIWAIGCRSRGGKERSMSARAWSATGDRSSRISTMRSSAPASGEVALSAGAGIELVGRRCAAREGSGIQSEDPRRVRPQHLLGLVRGEPQVANEAKVAGHLADRPVRAEQEGRRITGEREHLLHDLQHVLLEPL